MIVVWEKIRKFSAMRIAMAFLGVSVFLVGCGGDDGDSKPLSTTQFVPSTSTNKVGGGAPKAKAKAGPYDYKKLVKRRGAKPVMMGTNQVYRTYHFTSGTNRFTGMARYISTNGWYKMYQIKFGLKNGYEFQKYPRTTNLVHKIFYLRGLKNGREYAWHKNGKLKLQGEWTNGVRTGKWFLWHDDGNTNRVDSYLNGKYLGKHKLLVSGGLKLTWKAAVLKSTYVGQPQAIIMKGFGSPDQQKGTSWIYYGVRVIDAFPNQATATMIFTLQKGKVTAVNFAK